MAWVTQLTNSVSRSPKTRPPPPRGEGLHFQTSYILQRSLSQPWINSSTMLHGDAAASLTPTACASLAHSVWFGTLIELVLPSWWAWWWTSSTTLHRNPSHSELMPSTLFHAWSGVTNATWKLYHWMHTSCHDVGRADGRSWGINCVMIYFHPQPQILT